MANDRNRRRPSRADAPAHKDAFFVQVAGDGESPQYFNVTDKLGRPMPFTRPTATVALRVTDQMVGISLLMVSNRTRTNLAEQPLVMPDGPMARLARKSRAHRQLPNDRIVAELDGQAYTLTLDRDDAGVVTIEHVDADTEPVLFTLPRGGPKLTLFLTSPVTDRVLAISSMGARYPGKPGATDSLLRAVSMVLFSLSQLLEFRMLSGIETVDVPPAPARWDSPAATRPPVDGEASVDVPVWLFDGTPPVPVASGTVNVRIDLDNANPATGKLLLHLTPAPEIAAHFEPYRRQTDLSLTHLLGRFLGDAELGDLAVEIVLGGLDQGALDRLNEALVQLTPGLDLTPNQFRVHGT